MGRGLSLESRVHRQHDLVDPARRNAAHELVDAEVVGTNSFQRRKAPTKNVVETRKQPGTIERPEVRDFFDDAQHLLVAAGIAADAARIGRIHISAHRAG